MMIMRNKQIWIYLLLVFLCCLFYLRDLQEHDVGKMIIVLPIIFACILTSAENLYYLVALLLPLGWGISVSYIYPIIVILFLIRRNGPVIPCLIFALLIGIYEIIHYFIYPLPGGRFEPSLLLTFVCILFFTSYLIFSDNGVFNKEKFVFFFCLGTAVFLSMILLHSVVLYGLFGVLSGVYRLGDTGITNEMEATDIIFFRANANYVSYYSSACMAFVMVLLKREKISLLMSIMLLVIYLLAGFSTQSRTWIATVLLFFLCYAFSFKKHRQLAFIGTGLLCAGIFFFLMQFDDIVEAYMMRLSFDEANSSMSEFGGRPELIRLFNDYLRTHFDALIWGVGMNGQELICKIDNGATRGYRAPHNSIQQIIVCYGLIGFFLFVVPFLKRIVKLLKKYKPNFIDILPLVIVIIILQTIQVVYPPLLMAPLIPAVLILSKDNNNQRINEDTTSSSCY